MRSALPLDEDRYAFIFDDSGRRSPGPGSRRLWFPARSRPAFSFQHREYGDGQYHRQPYYQEPQFLSFRKLELDVPYHNHFVRIKISLTSATTRHPPASAVARRLPLPRTASIFSETMRARFLVRLISVPLSCPYLLVRLDLELLDHQSVRIALRTPHVNDAARRADVVCRDVGLLRRYIFP